MLESNLQTNHKTQNNKDTTSQPETLASMCKICAGIINQLYNPIDAVNRFINLALQSVDDDSQSRQFLIESKQGIRKTSLLLRKLDNYAKKIEKEIQKISPPNE